MNVPHGMTEVTREVFWRHVNAETRNVHPRAERNYTAWERMDTRQPWGWESIGYASEYEEPERYALVQVTA